MTAHKKPNRVSYVPFEFDPEKSAANLEKHGIDFVAAQMLWEGKTVEVPSREARELRRLMIGKIGQKYWTAIVTARYMKNGNKVSRKATTSANLEEKFDRGEEVLDYFDVSKAKVRNPKVRRLKLDLPEWLILALDHEASRLKVDREELIKLWIAERLRKAA